jgi:hypothetical protein
MIRDPLGGTLFVLVHLCGLHLIATSHLTCVFLLFRDDTRMVGLVSNVFFGFYDCNMNF